MVVDSPSLRPYCRSGVAIGFPWTSMFVSTRSIQSSPGNVRVLYACHWIISSPKAVVCSRGNANNEGWKVRKVDNFSKKKSLNSPKLLELETPIRFGPVFRTGFERLHSWMCCWSGEIIAVAAILLEVWKSGFLMKVFPVYFEPQLVLWHVGSQDLFSCFPEN